MIYMLGPVECQTKQVPTGQYVYSISANGRAQLNDVAHEIRHEAEVRGVNNIKVVAQRNMAGPTTAFGLVLRLRADGLKAEATLTTALNPLYFGCAQSLQGVVDALRQSGEDSVIIPSWESSTKYLAELQQSNAYEFFPRGLAEGELFELKEYHRLNAKLRR